MTRQVIRDSDWEPIVEFKVIGCPKPRGSKRPVRGGKEGKIFLIDSSKDSKAWMYTVSSAAHEAWGNELLIGPLALSVVFYFKRPAAHYGTGRNAEKLKTSAPVLHDKSPDLSKLVRGLEDAITGVIWRDDRQVCEYLQPTRRIWTESAEGASVTIWTPTENHA